MIIKSMSLQNFRNYESLNLQFDENTNIFYGDNAQGKTNILEAAYVSGTTKSHRGAKDREMISLTKKKLISVPGLKRTVLYIRLIYIFERIKQRGLP